MNRPEHGVACAGLHTAASRRAQAALWARAVVLRDAAGLSQRLRRLVGMTARHDAGRRHGSAALRLAAAVLLTAVAACDGTNGEDARIARLQSDLRLAQERIETLSGDLAQRSSQAAEVTLLREQLETAQTRIAELERAPGLTGSRDGDGGIAAAHERLEAAAATLSDVEAQLAALAETLQENGIEADLPRDSLRAALEDVDAAADLLGQNPGPANPP